MDLRSSGELPAIDLHALIEKLYPLPRSLTGWGVRRTFEVLSEYLDLEVTEIPSGTRAFDWKVPLEWNIRDAFIESLGGRRLVDFADNTLHVVGYSEAIDQIITKDELARHVHTLPDQPSLVPYRTGYFANDWGFCLTDECWRTMTDEAYRVVIDADLSPGALSYAEVFVPGEGEDEMLISAHVCHPSLANDNLSGIAVAAALALRQRQKRSRLGYRFLFVPGTIGALVWLSRNEQNLGKIKHGLVLTCVGDQGAFHYKRSRRGADIDQAVEHVLRHSRQDHAILPFSPYGYDERQFCSPGFDLPVGCFMRSVHGTFPQYHTSADNLDFVTLAALNGSFDVLAQIADVVDENRVYRRVDGRGEPQLGRRGLYRAIAGQKEAGGAVQMDLLWFLNLADGQHTLLDMARTADVPFPRIRAAARLALAAELVTVDAG